MLALWACDWKGVSIGLLELVLPDISDQFHRAIDSVEVDDRCVFADRQGI